MTSQPIISRIPTTPQVLVPTGDSNRRKVRCSECRCELKPGSGYAWDYNPAAGNLAPFARKHFLCRSDHEVRLAIIDQQPEIDQAQAEIRAWCFEHVAGGYARSAAGDISCLVVSAGLAGADVARAIADRLHLLPEQDRTYAGVMQLARRIVAQLCGGPLGGVA